VTRVRTRAALVVAATVTGLLVAPMSAAGFAPTCQGRPATIVVETNGNANGTQGDDVIVGRDNVGIDARGGNDLICLRSGGVDDGDGDDSILVTGPHGVVMATLGAGDDRFVGGPGSDEVYEQDVPDGLSDGYDIISTGAGRDFVATPTDVDFHIVVNLGAGADTMVIARGTPGSSAQIQGGQGFDWLDFYPLDPDHDLVDHLVVDLGTKVITSSGIQAVSFDGFEHYDLESNGHDLRVLGSSGPDRLRLEAERVDVQLGDGPDSLDLDPWQPEAGVIDLGGGEDTLLVRPIRRVVGDLVRGRLVLGSSARPNRVRLALLGVEGLQASGDRVVMRGGPASDWLTGFGCHIRMRGGAGSDHLRANFYPESMGCSAHEYGGAGRDHLYGGDADDELTGGPGNDEAHGRAGTDTCRAEREFSCER
jgi:Ca2+-binding RTX toxin-like protein